MKVEFHPDAENELIESACCYESKVDELGYRFISEIERFSCLFERYPELG